MLKEVEDRDDVLLFEHLGMFCKHLPRQIKSIWGNTFHAEFSQVTSTLRPPGQREQQGSQAGQPVCLGRSWGAVFLGKGTNHTINAHNRWSYLRETSVLKGLAPSFCDLKCKWLKTRE